jgi:predicted NBD/HSP70 family sugar kinase
MVKVRFEDADAFPALRKLGCIESVASGMALARDAKLYLKYQQ